MRFDGILTCWDDDRSSGIITPGKGGNDIAVHAAAFPRDGVVPSVGEALSFQVELGPDGNKRACSVLRLRMSARSAERQEQAKPSSSLVTAALLILAAGAAVYYASLRQHGQQPLALPGAALTPQAAAIPHERKTDKVAASRFARPATAACDGRTRCTQMNSCAEAKFFADNCEGAEMDGDGDGVPCESQWCTPVQAGKEPAL